jgi:hypothetical protein
VLRSTHTSSRRLSGQSCTSPTKSRAWSPPLRLSPLPYILCHLPFPSLTTCRRLDGQCDLNNSHVVVQSLALRFPQTPPTALSLTSHTPSHPSFLTVTRLLAWTYSSTSRLNRPTTALTNISALLPAPVCHCHPPSEGQASHFGSLFVLEHWAAIEGFVVMRD